MSDLFGDDDEASSGTGTATGLMGGGFPAVVQQETVVVKAPVGTTLDSIPGPYAPVSEGALSDREQADFEACKAGMDNLHKAFWIAGKSLETMKTANLHRNSGIPNFAEFVWVNWEVSESQAQRLMGEWRMGEALASLGWRPRESQVRELTEIAKNVGDAAGVAVYDTVARAGGRVTAAVLKDVVRKLPPIPGDATPVDVSKLVSQVIQQQSSTTDSNGGGGADSPIGESGAQSGNDKGQPGESPDIQRLVVTLKRLHEAGKGLSKPVVQRALTDSPETAAQLLKDIDDALNKVGRAIAGRRSAV
ncbi:hypothetical protein AB0H07_39190 [Streptomyces sp. NPDC021354]|uniref:hypothetical protein n=1 Tax=Streptomyces sp. NPDC021354 TaxID=3154793 RepID=UPI0033EA2392